jgi:hypothetical protein
MMGNKGVDHWTSGTACECSEFASSSQCLQLEIKIINAFRQLKTGKIVTNFLNWGSKVFGPNM